VAATVKVERPMVVGAKTYLLGLARNQAIDIWAQSTEWARVVAPGAASTIVTDSPDLEEPVRLVGLSISAKLAFGIAAWERVRDGVFIQTGPETTHSLSFSWQIGGQAGGSAK
jgi:hypothetical protein